MEEICRQFNPDSKGSIFMDTTSLIKNNEFIYSGFDSEFFNENIKINTTFRIDKNENFNYNFLCMVLSFQIK